ncbi:hypothetical protein DFH08DRAFT_827185 [Mycena albidolilacea]|uniref:Uncharacterized protein n=1 Tax=Mycena albidolilacea TaxID=1033008 RepID=A0AAD6YYL1_9AGAR|nr:hypothetical protein DFH08DRAFT_827185 [Mycena albidolilacea]
MVSLGVLLVSLLLLCRFQCFNVFRGSKVPPFAIDHVKCGINVGITHTHCKLGVAGRLLYLLLLATGPILQLCVMLLEEVINPISFGVNGLSAVENDDGVCFFSTLPTPDFQSLGVALWSSLDFSPILWTHMGFYATKDY